MQGTYPVIFLNFTIIKAVRYSDMEYKIIKVIADFYERNGYLLRGDLLSGNEKKYFESIQCGMGGEEAVDAIHSLSNFMQHYYGRDVIILLDEYDTPMQEAWLNGYRDKVAEFFR
mgnify:CR=1 FL=1